MPGFTSNDAIIAALSNGQTYKASWGKNFNPTLAAVAGEWHTLFRGGGNPQADNIFDVGSNLTFQSVKDNTTDAGCIQHSGNVQPAYNKYLINGSAVTAATTTVPGTLTLVDVVGFYRKTSVTNTTDETTTNTLSQNDTFTANAGTDTCTYTSTNSIPSNLLTGTRVRLTTTTTLPGNLSLATDYYLIKVSDTSFKLAGTYADAAAGNAIDISSAGAGTHTLNWLLPRYTNGAGLQTIIFNPSAVSLGAGVPNLSLGYTNAKGQAGRYTPTVLPIGKTATKNSHILYTGATGVGKYNYTMPLQGGDSGIAEINSIKNSTSYVSGDYTVAMINELGRFPLSTTGLSAERNFLFELPSLPRIYDGAALYWLWGSGLATPANSAFSGDLTFIWG